MIHLALVRHAKSDWGVPGVSDHDRPLNPRGRRDAPRMAEEFAQARFRPDIILTSTAVRARTTADAFGVALAMPVTPVDELYNATSATLLAQAAGTDFDKVLVVAHDPGMTELARTLSRNRILSMPTCAIATFRWDTDDWSVIDAVDPVEWTHDIPE